MVVRAVVGGAASAALFVGLGPSARRVSEARNALVQQLAAQHPRAPLATLDIGWVGAGARGVVVDLAGVSDPDVARLAGGHTSKQLKPDFSFDGGGSRR